MENRRKRESNNDNKIINSRSIDDLLYEFCSNSGSNVPKNLEHSMNCSSTNCPSPIIFDNVFRKLNYEIVSEAQNAEIKALKIKSIYNQLDYKLDKILNTPNIINSLKYIIPITDNVYRIKKIYMAKIYIKDVLHFCCLVIESTWKVNAYMSNPDFVIQAIKSYFNLFDLNNVVIEMETLNMNIKNPIDNNTCRIGLDNYDNALCQYFEYIFGSKIDINYNKYHHDFSINSNIMNIYNVQDPIIFDINILKYFNNTIEKYINQT